MEKNNIKTMIKRTIIVILVPIAIILVPYFVGDMILLPDAKPTHITPIVWLIGLFVIVLVGLMGAGIYWIAKPIYEWVLYKEEED
jgi:hypothetical protein